MKAVLIKVIVVVFAISVTIVESWAEKEPKRSDGAVFKCAFDNDREVADWEKQGNGNFGVKDKALVFAQSDGDNAVDHPEYKLDNIDEYVLQGDFRIPEKAVIKTPFMIFGLLSDQDGGLNWRTNFKVSADLGDQYTVGVQDPAQVEFEPKLEKGKAYTATIHIASKSEAHYFMFDGNKDPGTFLGTINITSNHSHKVRIGNVFGAGSGELVIDNLMLGKPIKGMLAVRSRSKLYAIWGKIKASALTI